MDAKTISTFFQAHLKEAVKEGCMEFNLHKLPEEDIKILSYEVAKTLNEPLIIEGFINEFRLETNEIVIA